MKKYNFESATEKRQVDREYGYVLIPDPDSQEKHPEHKINKEEKQIQESKINSLKLKMKQCEKFDNFVEAKKRDINKKHLSFRDFIKSIKKIENL